MMQYDIFSLVLYDTFGTWEPGSREILILRRNIPRGEEFCQEMIGAMFSRVVLHPIIRHRIEGHVLSATSKPSVPPPILDVTPEAGADRVNGGFFKSNLENRFT